MPRIKKTALLRVLILTAVICLIYYSTFSSTTFNIKPIHDRAEELKEDVEFFYGPSRVPVIPEQRFPKPQFNTKYFIYDCNFAAGACGGLGDREEGIVAAYLISQMMGRRFGVQITTPCDVRNVLMENKDSWIVNESSLQDLSALHYRKIDNAAFEARAGIHKMDLEHLFPSDVVYFTVNQEFVQYLMKMPRFSVLKWAQNRTVADIYNIVLRRLFRLKPVYQETFDKFQNSVRRQGRQLACAHIRLQDYRKGDYHVDSKISEYVGIIWSLLKRYNNTKTYRIFVATNAELVRREAKEMFPEVVVDVDGPIIHVDEDVLKPSCEGMAKTHIDQMILSTCDVFIMSDSGFGRVAAMIRGTDDNLYNLEGKVSYKDKDFLPDYW